MRLFAGILLLLLVSGCVQQDTACFDDHCFSIEIAETPEERESGLMHRESLPENSGMLFIFPEEGYHSFWMKNTNIPLDIIWIDSGMKVVHIERGAEPCREETCPSMAPDEKALYVLEINAGAADNISIGDSASIGSFK